MFRLGLGTVQFGLDYGISNSSGKVSLAQVREILDEAFALSVPLLDCAPLYGDAEAVLGETSAGNRFKIVTKTPQFKKGKIDPEDAAALYASLQASLQRLKIQAVYALMVHNADDLLAQDGKLLFAQMQQLKSEGLVEKIGASVYSAEQIDKLLEIGTPDLVQLPLNVFDQRLVKSGHLKKLKDLDVEVHARSVFLQGILLMAPEELPEFFSPVRDTFARYSAELGRSGVSPLQAAISFVLDQKEVDFAICGVTSKDELQQIVAAANSRTRIDVSPFTLDDPRFVNPVNWKI